MEYIFIATTVLLVGYAILTVIFIRTRLTAGPGMGLTSLLLVISSCYVLFSGNHQLSILLFLVSVVLPLFLAGLMVHSRFLKTLVKFYFSLVRIGVSSSAINNARAEYSKEIMEILERRKGGE